MFALLLRFLEFQHKKYTLPIVSSRISSSEKTIPTNSVFTDSTLDISLSYMVSEGYFTIFFQCFKTFQRFVEDEKIANFLNVAKNVKNFLLLLAESHKTRFNEWLAQGKNKWI